MVDWSWRRYHGLPGRGPLGWVLDRLAPPPGPFTIVDPPLPGEEDPREDPRPAPGRVGPAHRWRGGVLRPPPPPAPPDGTPRVWARHMYGRGGAARRAPQNRHRAETVNGHTEEVARQYYEDLARFIPGSAALHWDYARAHHFDVQPHPPGG